MAWPYDARDVNYAPNTPVTSNNLNNIQDEINNTVGQHVMFLVAGMSDGNAVLSSTEIYGWEATAAADLLIPVPARPGSVISQVKFKCYESDGAGAWAFDIHRVYMRIDTDTTTAPNVPVATDGSAPSPSSGWFVETLNGGNLPATLSDEYQWVLQIAMPGSGDRVAGAEITFDQLY
jgi:hypothetical protein